MYKINPCVADIELNEQNICNLCQKKVLDISSFPESEVLELNKNTPGGICVSGSISRMNTAYYLHPFRRFALAILVVFGSSVFILDAKAQDTIQQIQKNILPSEDSISIHYTTFEGFVMSTQNKEVLPFANVWIEINGIKIGTTTDIDGKYRLRIANNLNSLLDSITLNCSFVGYKKTVKQITLQKGESLVNTNIELDEMDEFLHFYGMPVSIDYQNISDPNSHRSTTIRRNEIEKMPRNE